MGLMRRLRPRRKLAAAVDHDASQPRLEALDVPQLGQLTPGAEERFLGGIGGIVRTNDGRRQPVQLRRVAVDEHGERIHVAALGPFHCRLQLAPPLHSRAGELAPDSSDQPAHRFYRRRVSSTRLPTSRSTAPMPMMAFGRVPSAASVLIAVSGSAGVGVAEELGADAVPPAQTHTSLGARTGSVTPNGTTSGFGLIDGANQVGDSITPLDRG